jgi:predicted PurR-regulated permease PerM
MPSIFASALIFLLFYLLLIIFQPFITALILAAVIVILGYPIHKKITRKIPNSWAALASTLLVFFIIIIPGLLIASGIVNEAINFSKNFQSMSLEKIMIPAHTFARKLGVDLNAVIQEIPQKIASQAGQFASYIISNVWNIIIGIITTLLATFFFFRDGEKIAHFINSFFMNMTWSKNLIKEIVVMIKSNIAATFIAASIQGTIGGLTFAWLGLPAPILWGTVMGFFSIFPFIGSWLVWIPVAIVLISSGRLWDAVLLIVIGILVVNPVDNILRPAIIATAMHLNGLLVFIGFLGGVQAFGLSGLLLGPIILILVAGLLKNSQEYLNTHFFKSNN